MFNGNELEIVQDYKYLGIVFNSIERSHGNVFKCMKTYTMDKALKASFGCFKKVSHLGKVTPRVGYKLFDSFVSPILDYGCELWSNEHIDELERVQLKYLKMLLGVKSSTCNIAVYCETGRYPIQIRHKLRLLKYWCRLTRLDDNKVVKTIFLYLKSLSQQGFKTWASKLYSLLESHNLEHVYEMDSISKEYENVIVNQVKHELYSEFEKKCILQLYEYSSMRTYRTFKVQFGNEFYLEHVKDFKLRKWMCKFRLSSHDLQIEKGRHLKRKQLIEERLCQFCNYQEVEDELHFFMMCPFYRIERNSLFSKIVLIQPNLIDLLHAKDTFCNIMKSTDGNIIFSVCKYLQKCFRKRV